MTIITCVALVTLEAQTPVRKSVVLDYFSKSSSVPSTARDLVRAAVLTSLTNSGRINLIDAANTTALQLTEEASDADVIPTVDNIRQTSMLESGGNFLMSGNVTSVDATRKRDSEGKVYYSGMVTFSINIVDLSTGQSVAAKDITYNELNAKSGHTKEEAIVKTIDFIPISIRQFVEQHFKVETKIIQINAEKKGRVSEVFINAGSAIGITKSQVFGMFIESEVAGYKRRTEIGKLTAISIEGEHLTLCRVTKSSDLIKEYFNNGVDIIVVTDGQRAGSVMWDAIKASVK